jgi:hypothetical protein
MPILLATQTPLYHHVLFAKWTPVPAPITGFSVASVPASITDLIVASVPACITGFTSLNYWVQTPVFLPIFLTSLTL